MQTWHFLTLVLLSTAPLSPSGSSPSPSEKGRGMHAPSFLPFDTLVALVHLTPVSTFCGMRLSLLQHLGQGQGVGAELWIWIQHTVPSLSFLTGKTWSIGYQTQMLWKGSRETLSHTQPRSVHWAAESRVRPLFSHWETCLFHGLQFPLLIACP